MMKATTLLAVMSIGLFYGTLAGQAVKAGPPAANAASSGQLDVRAFGDLGDGRSNDAAAIQKAIDACFRQGGGVVVLDRGTFLTGTLALCSHVELHLTSTAVLKGVSDLAQYKADPQEVYKLLNQSLIFAQNCEHIAITGEGTIDGSGKALPRR